MSSETSTPYTPAFTFTTVAGNKTVLLANNIKKYDTTKLIEFLKGRDLGLTETALKILEEEEINGLNFLDMTKQDFQEYDMKGEPAITLMKFTKNCKEKKLKAFSSYCSLKKILTKYGINSNSTNTISLFTL